PRQRHAAQPDRGHRKPLGAERAARKFLHRRLLSKLRTPEGKGWYSLQGRTGTFKPPAGALSCPTTWVRLNCNKSIQSFLSATSSSAAPPSGTWPRRHRFFPVDPRP